MEKILKLCEKISQDLDVTVKIFNFLVILTSTVLYLRDYIELPFS